MVYNWNVVGHDQQLKQLENDLQKDNVSHAYLFSGPRQTGKFRIVRRLAAFLQSGDSLDSNSALFKAIIAGRHPDTLFLKDDGESLKIDTIRKLIGKAHLTAQSPYRIIAIQNIERMPMEAQNSFLKTLEEPPGKTLFLLTTSHINKVLPTIRSRVRHTPFFNVSDAHMRQFLEREFGGEPTIEEVINMAQGRPGLAISLIQNPELLSQQRHLYATIERFLKQNDLAEKFAFVETMTSAKEGGDLEFFLDAFTRYLRKLLFEYVENDDHVMRSRFDLMDLVNLFESLEKTRYLMERNVNKKLALENFLIQTEKQK